MPDRSLNKFFLSIVLPSFLAIVLFIISFYAILIPMFEKSMMDRKKEMILELTNAAWSVLEEYRVEFDKGKLSLDEAQQNAILQIQQMRYGNKQKDYFWIIDHEPRMIMHPYRKDLNNKDLSDYKDSHENKLFVDAVEVIDSLDQGFIEYYWQWKDDETKDVPKLSFVKGFSEWNWIIGTGIYLDDVSAEISTLKRRLLKISGFIIVVIILTLIYVMRQSLIIENKRRSAEKNLKLSRQKYKSLVEASTEGTLMILENKVIFANAKFVNMYFRGAKSVVGKTFNDLFKIGWNELINEIIDPEKSVSIETQIVNGNSEASDVVITVSKVNYSKQLGYIVVVKSVSRQKQIELSSKKLSDELQSSLQLMNQSIEPFIKAPLFCDLSASIKDAAKEMQRKKERVIFVRLNQKVIGVVNSNDLKDRVVAQGVDPEQSVADIMTSPVQSIFSGALLYEAVLRFKNLKVSHLLVKDTSGVIIGTIGNQECLEVQRNSLSYLIQQIKISQTIKELKELYGQLPVLISALVSSSDNISHITRLITTVSDAVSNRVIMLGIDQVGKPPCNFAFIAMGSAGRSEQTLNTDQDNAIIYEDTEADVQPYFLKLADYINENLNTIGYNKCKGLVMANNIKWCQPISKWLKYFSYWIDSKDLESLLDSKIFFDLKHIHGDKALSDKLRMFFIEEAKKNSMFLYHLASSIVNYKPAFEQGTIDLKKVMLPIVEYLRINTLANGINETNSMSRLDELFEIHKIDPEQREEIEKTYEFLMHQRIKNQIKQIENNELPGNIVEERMLTSIERSVLKNVLKQIQGLQNELNVVFRSE